MLSLFGQLVSVSSSTLAFIYVFLSPKGHDWALTNQQSDMPGTLGVRYLTPSTGLVPQPNLHILSTAIV